MSNEIADIVRELLARAPEWIRSDLVSKDSSERARAEDTLAAMIAAALDKNEEAQPEPRPAFQHDGDER